MEEDKIVKVIATDKDVLFCIHLEKIYFTELKCQNKMIRIDMDNLTSLCDIIKTIKKIKDDEEKPSKWGRYNYTTSICREDTDYLHIEIITSNKHTETKLEYNFKILDTCEEKIKMLVPDITFDLNITMKFDRFYEICRKMSRIGKNLEIEYLNDNLIFTCKDKEQTTKKTLTYKEFKDSDINIYFHGNEKLNIVQGVYELKNLAFVYNNSLNDSYYPYDIKLYIKNNGSITIKYTTQFSSVILYTEHIKIEK